MDTLKNMPGNTIEKPKKRRGKKDKPSPAPGEPSPSPLPSANPPVIEPGKAAPKIKPQEPAKHPGGPVEDDAGYPQEFKSKEKLKKEAEKMRESEHLS